MLCRLLSLPMLALLLAIPVIAYAAPNGDSTHCTETEDQSSSDKPALLRFTPDRADTDSTTQFSATRPLSQAPLAAPPHTTAHITLCRASLTITPSSDTSAHLLISLGKPLSSEQLVSTFVRHFVLTGSRLELDIEAPEGASPRVSLALPLGTTTELALVSGDLNISHLLGDSQIAIVKGNATLHLADADFSSLECATIVGGIRDRRPGGNSHGHVLSTWTTHGTGTAKVQVSAVSGDLILLPPSS